MNKKKSGSIIKKLIFVVGAAGVLVVLMWLVFVFADRWLNKQPKVSDSDISQTDASEQSVEVKLNTESVDVGKGLKVQLTATGGQNIVFHSSDEGIATVDENGLVEGASVGQCTVTAKNEYGSSVDCTVNVKKVCYLTIDDGPTDNTENLLALLKEYDVRVTFFVVNSQYLNLTKNMQDQGCVVGLHTNSHVFKMCYASYYSYFYGGSY